MCVCVYVYKLILVEGFYFILFILHIHNAYACQLSSAESDKCLHALLLNVKAAKQTAANEEHSECVFNIGDVGWSIKQSDK